MRRERLWRPPGTAARLVAFHALLLAVVLAAVTYETERAFTSHALDTTDRSLAAQLSGFGRAAAARPVGQSLDAFAIQYLRSSVLPRGEMLVVAVPPAPTVGSAGSEALLHSPAVASLASGPPRRSGFARSDVAGVPTEVLTSPIRSGPRPIGTLLVAARLDQLTADQRRVLALAGAEAAVALVVGVAAAYLLLRRLLRTVGTMTTAAAAIGSGDLDQRLGYPGTDDEVGQLAATLDWMLDRLSQAMVSQRRLLSDVSHQLRTPLTVARGHLEILVRTGTGDPAEVRATVATVVDELDHMRALVERLLLLGRALEPDFLAVQPVDVRSLVAELVDAGRVLAPRRWGPPLAPDLVVEVDEAKLRGALLNLMDNAVHATGPGGRIEVWAGQRQDGSVELVVDDGGPGIPPDQLAVALARFGRPGTADSTGSGLGLAIVKAVAEAHGGSFEIGPSPLGGCRATIVLSASRVLGPEAVEVAALER